MALDDTTDDEVRDFLLQECLLSKEDMEVYISKEAEIRSLGASVQSDLFLSGAEIDQLFRVMRSIVGGTTSNDPISDYDRAMGII